MTVQLQTLAVIWTLFLVDITVDLGSYTVNAYKGGPQQFYGHFSYTVGATQRGTLRGWEIFKNFQFLGVPANNNLLTGTVPTSKSLLTGTVLCEPKCTCQYNCQVLQLYGHFSVLKTA